MSVASFLQYIGYIVLICVIATALAVVGVYCQSKSGKAKHNGHPDGPNDPNNEDEVDLHSDAQGEISEQENCSTCSSIPWKEYMPNDGTETSNLETDSQSNRIIEDQQNDDRNIENQQNDGLYHEEEDDVFVVATDAIRNLTVKEGQAVTLSTDVTTIEEDDVILWTFAESTECNQTVEFKSIAGRTRANEWEYLCGYERFRDRLQLDNQTGSLTITNIRCVHAGLYKLCMPRKKTWKTFIVAVKPKIQRRNTVE